MKQQLGWRILSFAAIGKAALLPAFALRRVIARWPGSVPQAVIPLPPIAVTNATSTGQWPCSGTPMENVLISYWSSIIERVRKRCPKTRSYRAYRRHSLPLADLMHRRGGDPETLIAKLDADAREKGCSRLDDISDGNLVYELRCYEHSAHVSCVLGFTDALKDASFAGDERFDRSAHRSTRTPRRSGAEWPVRNG